MSWKLISFSENFLSEHIFKDMGGDLISFIRGAIIIHGLPYMVEDNTFLDSMRDLSI